MTTETKGYRSADWNSQQQHHRSRRERLKEPNPSDSKFFQKLRFQRGMKELAQYWQRLGWGSVF